MKKITTYLSLLFMALILTQSTTFAQEDKIKFDKQTYNLSEYTEKPPEYEYYLKGENKDKWGSRITLSNFPELTNATEAAADMAHKIQEQTPGASVLVYPDVAMIEFINFPTDRAYYEYNSVIYQPAKTNGLDLFKYTKRFYSNDLNGTEGARKAAIEFAQNNSQKYMEMVNNTASKYKID